MMKRRLSVCVFLSLLLLLAACGSPVDEQEPEDLVDLDPAATASPAIQTTLPPTEEAAAPTRLATAMPTETATPTATAMPTEMETAEPNQTPTATATIVAPPPTQIPRDNRTSIPEIDFVIDTVLSNDLEARQELVRFVTLGCTTADGLGLPPKCEGDQVDGTLVEYFPLGGPGEGHSVPASEVARVLDFEAESLYAAYVVSEDLPDHVDFPRGTYALFFITVSSGESNKESVILRVDDEGHIVRLDGLVGMPLDFYFQQKAADLIDPPPQTLMFASEAAEILVYPPETDK
jgi:hypothetical protein